MCATTHSPLLLFKSRINTPLGVLVALAHEQALLLLSFEGLPDLSAQINRMLTFFHAHLLCAKNILLQTLEQELTTYFDGHRVPFHTPVELIGSPFQKTVWRELQGIPIGKTCSYLDIARRLGTPSAFRAVARANSANPIAILVPCHRVIHADGRLGGYNGGAVRKRWLLSLEKRGDLPLQDGVKSS